MRMQCTILTILRLQNRAQNHTSEKLRIASKLPISLTVSLEVKRTNAPSFPSHHHLSSWYWFDVRNRDKNTCVYRAGRLIQDVALREEMPLSPGVRELRG